MGLFFDERVGWLQVIGDVYVGLLQMTVLPFIVVSLVTNIGRFSIDEGPALAKIGALEETAPRWSVGRDLLGLW